MPNVKTTPEQETWEELKESTIELQDVPALAKHAAALLAAIEYQDKILVSSHTIAILDSFRNLLENRIRSYQKAPENLRQGVSTALDKLKCRPVTNCDEFGHIVSSYLDQAIDHLDSLKEAAKEIEQVGQKVENMAGLDKVIEEIQQLKNETLNDWPWSNLPLPPTDMEMVAESRAMLTPRPDESVEDMLRRLNLKQG